MKVLLLFLAVAAVVTAESGNAEAVAKEILTEFLKWNIPQSHDWSRIPHLIACTSKVIGDVSEPGLQIKDALLKGKLADYNIDYTDSGCPYGRRGLKIEVCDYSVNATVSLLDLNYAYIHRNGDLGGPAIVRSKEYCSRILQTP